jgi:superfamily II DNA or RNA helicase
MESNGEAAGGPHWLSLVDRGILKRLVSARTLRIALASPLRYVELPSLDEDTVRAVLGTEGTAGGADTFHVSIRMQGMGALLGECSRCSTAFGPCTHMAVLVVDLCCFDPLRDALLDRTRSGVAEAAACAREVRLALDLDLQFEAGLGAWVAPAAEGLRVEIAASPFTEIDAHVGRNYGDRVDPAQLRALSVVVRRAGERRLLAAREIAPPVQFGTRDRRVLEHVRDRGGGKKAAYALGVEASLAIEAMRAHGGVFADGWKALLDFREGAARPRIALSSVASGTAAGHGARGLRDALVASWRVDDEDVTLAFADVAFFAGPFPHVWTRAGAIYRVARDVDLDFVAGLVKSPVLTVPMGKLRDAGARLHRAARGRGIALPEHEVFGLPPRETPRFVLRLTGDPLDVTGELVAVYRAREFPLFGDAAAGGAASAIDEMRDVEHEALARSVVVAAGAVRRGDDEDDDEGGGAGGDAPPRVAFAGEAAVVFWQSGLASLRACDMPVIEVALSQRLARVRVGAPITARVNVVLEGDWLDTELEFASKQLPVELSAIRAALAQKQRWVALSDGTLTRIEASIEALSEEAALVMEGRSAARLPAHQLGRLDRWIAENDGRIDAAVAGLRKRLRALAVAAEPDMPEGLSATLRPYQRLGVAWLQFLQVLGAGGILADDMGLGKTITTLAFLLRRKELEGPMPSLVVCPTSVASNWVREAARFTPGLEVTLLHGPSRDARAALPLAGSDVVVTTYALLRRDVEALAATRFRCVVLDEAQNIKNADSATSRAANRLDASMRIALSGTPIENRLRELWSLASFVNPGILGTARAFETRFERPIGTDRGSPLAAELRAVVRPFLLRRTKDDVLPELPPKTEIDRVVTLKRADKRMYDALAHTLRQSVARDLENRAGGPASLSVFTALTRLRQMACDPRLVDPRLGPGESAKREAFLELVRELVAEGRRALVFSQFVALLTLWRRDLDAEGIAYAYLDGSTTDRDRVVSEFQEGSAPLFLISLKAGGAGLNLTAADTVIHCDPWWNPAVEDQATDRAYRIGQDKPVTVVRLVAKGTIEEKILALKAKKRELSSAVIGDDARALEGITDEDIRALLGDAAGDAADDAGDAEDDEEDAAPDESGAGADRYAGDGAEDRAAGVSRGRGRGEAVAGDDRAIGERAGGAGGCAGSLCGAAGAGGAISVLACGGGPDRGADPELVGREEGRRVGGTTACPSPVTRLALATTGSCSTAPTRRMRASRRRRSGWIC